MTNLELGFTLAAVALNGILAGASLDQSIKQLPARKHTGAVAYSLYSRASDLRHGIAWYAAIGLGAALVTVIGALIAYVQGTDAAQGTPLFVAAILSVVHTAVTARAAPLMLSQRRYAPEANNEEALRALFNQFARWQALRALLQLLTFCSLLTEILVLIR